jgi:zinc transport system ATP-binding protein
VQKLWKARTRIGYVPQHPQFDLSCPVTASEVVLMGAVSQAGMFKRFTESVRTKASSLLEQVGMADSMQQQFGTLSGGQQQRVLIARALITDPQLLILDEPMAPIDVQGQQDFYEFLRKLKEQRNLTLLIVSHDVGHLVYFADQIACLYRCIHWHNRAELISEEAIERVYACCELDSYLAEHRRHIKKFHSRSNNVHNS